MTCRHGRILAELSELGLALARDFQARALATVDDTAAAGLGLAFHRAARSVRQSVALEARLERDRRRDDREAKAFAARDTQDRVLKRKAQARAAVTRLIWTEAEGEEAEALLEDLEDRLSEVALDDDFSRGPLETDITRLSADLGLCPADPDAQAADNDARALPDLAAREAADAAFPTPAWARAPAPVDWRSSA